MRVGSCATFAVRRARPEGNRSFLLVLAALLSLSLPLGPAALHAPGPHPAGTAGTGAVWSTAEPRGAAPVPVDAGSSMAGGAAHPVLNSASKRSLAWAAGLDAGSLLLAFPAVPASPDARASHLAATAPFLGSARDVLIRFGRWRLDGG